MASRKLDSKAITEAAKLIVAGESKRSVALNLGVAPSTVSRSKAIAKKVAALERKKLAPAPTTMPAVPAEPVPAPSSGAGGKVLAVIGWGTDDDPWAWDVRYSASRSAATSGLSEEAWLDLQDRRRKAREESLGRYGNPDGVLDVQYEDREGNVKHISLDPEGGARDLHSVAWRLERDAGINFSVAERTLQTAVAERRSVKLSFEEL